MPTLTLKPPLRGVVKSTSFQSHSRGALLSSSDMWPLDPSLSRWRLAVRPAFATAGSEAAVNLIHSLDVAADSDGNPAATTYGRQLMIAKGGALRKHTTGTSFSNVGTGVVDQSRNVQAASFLNKLYIANVTLAYQVYSYADDSVAEWTAAEGTIPPDCPIISKHMARLVLAGNADAPHVVSMSRTDEPDDWDFTGELTDKGRAIQFATIQEPVTALMPHTRDCLVIGTRNALWIVSGNPAGGGQVYKLPSACGPINAAAWCSEPSGRKWFMSRNGLAYMDGQCGSPPVEVSRDIIPESLRNLDGVNTKAYLEYDTLFRCIHIYVEGTNSQYFHYFPGVPDEAGSFWPVTTPGAGILAMARYDPLETGDVSGVLIGTTANLKRLDRTVFGGSSVAHATMLFPISGSPDHRSKILSMVATIGESTSDTTGTIDIHTAESMENAASLPTSRKVSWTVEEIQASRRTTINLSGSACTIKYTQGSASSDFSLEQFDLQVQPRGKERLP